MEEYGSPDDIEAIQQTDAIVKVITRHSALRNFDPSRSNEVCQGRLEVPILKYMKIVTCLE